MWISIVTSFAGVILGWILSEITKFIKERPKLCYQMVDVDKVAGSIDSKNWTKTSVSELAVRAINIGETPILIDHIDLLKKKKSFLNLYSLGNTTAILPYQTRIFILNKTELEELKSQYYDNHLRKCRVIAYSVDTKKYKGELLVSMSSDN